MFVFQGSHSNVRVPRFTFQGLCPNVCVPRFAFQGSHSEAHVPRFGFQGSCSKVRIPRLIFQGLHSCIQNFALRSCFAFLNRNKFWVFFFGASTRWPAISATLLTLDLFTGQCAPPPPPCCWWKQYHCGHELSISCCFSPRHFLQWNSYYFYKEKPIGRNKLRMGRRMEGRMGRRNERKVEEKRKSEKIQFTNNTTLWAVQTARLFRLKMAGGEDYRGEEDR